MINAVQLADIARFCEDNSLGIEDAINPNANIKIWESIKNTRFSYFNICQLMEAFAKGSTRGVTEDVLTCTTVGAIKILERKNQNVEQFIEYIDTYSSQSPNDKSPPELEIASQETLDISGSTWGEISNTIKLITKYSAMSQIGKSVFELKDVTCETLKYAHQHGLNIKSIIYDGIDSVYQKEIDLAKNNFHLKQEHIKKNSTGLIRCIQLFKEKVGFELYRNHPIFSARELCDRIISPDRKYN
jgi:hypothetical protein